MLIESELWIRREIKRGWKIIEYLEKKAKDSQQSAESLGEVKTND